MFDFDEVVCWCYYVVYCVCYVVGEWVLVCYILFVVMLGIDVKVLCARVE